MDADTTLLRYVAPAELPHDDGLRWHREVYDHHYNPNAKHLASMNAEWKQKHPKGGK